MPSSSSSPRKAGTRADGAERACDSARAANKRESVVDSTEEKVLPSSSLLHVLPKAKNSINHCENKQIAPEAFEEDEALGTSRGIPCTNGDDVMMQFSNVFAVHRSSSPNTTSPVADESNSAFTAGKAARGRRKGSGLHVLPQHGGMKKKAEDGVGQLQHPSRGDGMVQHVLPESSVAGPSGRNQQNMMMMMRPATAGPYSLATHQTRSHLLPEQDLLLLLLARKQGFMQHQPATRQVPRAAATRIHCSSPTVGSSVFEMMHQDPIPFIGNDPRIRNALPGDVFPPILSPRFVVQQVAENYLASPPLHAFNALQDQSRHLRGSLTPSGRHSTATHENPLRQNSTLRMQSSGNGQYVPHLQSTTPVSSTDVPYRTSLISGIGQEGAWSETARPSRPTGHVDQKLPLAPSVSSAPWPANPLLSADGVETTWYSNGRGTGAIANETNRLVAGDGYPVGLPTALALPNQDYLKLSPHQVFLRQQIEAFRASKSDTLIHKRGRNKPITVDQVGIRCRHCAHIPVHQRQRGSTYFPASLSGLYQAGQNMSTMHLQCGLCSEMPDSVRRQFALLISTKVTSSGVGRPYWEKAAAKIGLIDSHMGIRFVRDVPPSSDDEQQEKNETTETPKEKKGPHSETPIRKRKYATCIEGFMVKKEAKGDATVSDGQLHHEDKKKSATSSFWSSGGSFPADSTSSPSSSSQSSPAPPSS